MAPLSPSSEAATGQGPDAVAGLLTSPPWYVVAVLVLASLLAAAAVVRRIYERDITLEEQREMQVVLGTLVGVGTITAALGGHAATPWYVDVAGGFLGGYAPVILLQTATVAGRVGEVFPSAVSRRSMGWMGLVFGGFAMYGMAALVELAGLLRFGALVVLAIAVGMLVYTSIRRAESDETTDSVMQ